MKPGFLNCEHTRTPFIQINTRKCKACWKCLENCPNQIVGKVDLRWHKHTLIVKPGLCIGCFKCMEVCENDVFSRIDRVKQGAEMQRKRTLNSFLVNILLLVSGLVMIFSGLVLQLGFHMGGPGEHQAGVHEIQSQSMQYEQVRGIDTDKIVCWFTFPVWSAIHRFVIVLFSLLMIYHIYAYWKWYKQVVAKRLIHKNIQMITLSVLFLFVAITGFIPWFIYLSGSVSSLRIVFIEIHDKLALVLIIFLILHIVKRAKWFVTSYKKLKI